MAGRISYYGNIVKDGLILDLDAAKRDSYPGTGTIWNDISRFQNNGTLINGPTFNNGNGGSIMFDGVDDKLSSEYFPNTTINHISVCIKPTTTINSLSAGASLIGFRKNSTSSGQLDSNWYIALGQITLLLANEYIVIADLSGNFRTGVTDGGSLSSNTWNLICFNWNGSYYDIYVNNVLKTVVSSASGHAKQLTNPNCLFAGYRTGDGAVDNAFYNGNISYAMVYNKSLTSNEMTQNYNATKTRYGI